MSFYGFMRFEKFTFSICLEIWSSMNGHINETAPPLVPIGEVKLVQVQIVVWFVRTCEVWILFVFVLFPLFVKILKQGYMSLVH